MGRGSKPGGGEIFRTRPQRPRDPHSLVPWVKQSVQGLQNPTPPSAEVEERAELYVYPPSRPSWPVVGRTTPLSSYFFDIHFMIMERLVILRSLTYNLVSIVFLHQSLFETQTKRERRSSVERYTVSVVSREGNALSLF
jgi:hypothetical protein